VTRNRVADRAARNGRHVTALGNDAPALIAVTVMVPPGAVADIQLQAEVMHSFRHLIPGPLRDPSSGKLVSAKAALNLAKRFRQTETDDSRSK
jgi:hypothetical protein